ncbi:hypothetical protein ACQRIT_004730 [Beauveria bassiana]
MRIRLSGPRYSSSCLLFDSDPDDLRIITNRLVSVGEIDWQNPLGFLIMLVQDMGRTSEAKRDQLDLKILQTEIKTGSTSWGNEDGLAVRWPEDSYQTMSAMHICQNNLVFVTRAIDEEADFWRQLREMTEDEALWAALKGTIDRNQKEKILWLLECELAVTRSRQTQVRGLKERNEVQIDLIHNMMAHQEASQTNLIAIVALVFAPASLTAVRETGNPNVMARLLINAFDLGHIQCWDIPDEWALLL